jgi:hypothetical protein
MTVITDGLMAVALLIVGLLLLRVGRRGGQFSVVVWGTAFFIMGVASITAGITHGIMRNFSQLSMQLVWDATIGLVGIGSFLMLLGSARATCGTRAFRVLIALAALKLVVYIVWIATHDVTLDDYHVVMYDYGASLLVILVLHSYAAFAWRARGALWMVAGVVVAFIAGAVQQSGIVLHEYFNYNDLYHLISLVSFYTIYRGARLLTDRSGLPITRS